MPKRLLLPSARAGVLLEQGSTELSPWWRRIALVLGIAAVLIGSADVISRLAESLGNDIAFFAFAPAVLLTNPSLAPLVQGTSTAAFVPTRLKVSSLGIDAPVELVGQKADGAMAAPTVLSQVGWYKLGSKPGGEGSAVFAGHVNNSLGLGGVFEHLSKIAKNDRVTIMGADGESLQYVVEQITIYDKDDAPLEELFAADGPSRVVLITCEGEWEPGAGTFDKRLVVVAQLLNP